MVENDNGVVNVVANATINSIMAEEAQYVNFVVQNSPRKTGALLATGGLWHSKKNKLCHCNGGILIYWVYCCLNNTTKWRGG